MFLNILDLRLCSVERIVNAQQRQRRRRLRRRCGKCERDGWWVGERGVTRDTYIERIGQLYLATCHPHRVTALGFRINKNRPMASTNYTLHYASHLYIHYRSIKAQVFNSSHKSGVRFRGKGFRV